MRPAPVLPNRALCLPTFSHFVIVNNPSLSSSALRKPKRECTRSYSCFPPTLLLLVFPSSLSCRNATPPPPPRRPYRPAWTKARLRGRPSPTNLHQPPPTSPPTGKPLAPPHTSLNVFGSPQCRDPIIATIIAGTQSFATTHVNNTRQ